VRTALVPFGLYAVEKGCAATCPEFWLLALASCYRRAFGKPEMLQTGSMQTLHCWQKCIANSVDYAEKQCKTFYQNTDFYIKHELFVKVAAS